MEVILDTSFILSCIKGKIDFLDADKFGDLIIPRQVIHELEKLSKKDNSKNSENAKLALKIIKANKQKIKLISLDKKFVDKGILDYVNNKKNIAVATLDKELKRKLKGKTKIIVIRARKKLEMIE